MAGQPDVCVSSGEPGLQIVDAQAARFGEFDDVQLVGLIDGEWPERVRRNVLYPTSLLSAARTVAAESRIPGAASGRRSRPRARASRICCTSHDGACGCRRSCSKTMRWSNRRFCSTMSTTFALSRQTAAEPSDARDSHRGAGARTAQGRDVLCRRRRGDGRWRALIATAAGCSGFQGEAGPWMLPRVSVSRLERYLDCPFRFFASEVLRLEEQPEDEDTRTPLERGRFLHELLERFFSEWQRRGHGRIDLIAARGAAAVRPRSAKRRWRSCRRPKRRSSGHGCWGRRSVRASRIACLPWRPSGPSTSSSACSSFRCRATFVSARRDGRERTVTLSAKTDRIDLLEDGTLRVIDYKSKKTPDLKVALQLPIYSFVRATLARGIPQPAVDAGRSAVPVVRGQRDGRAIESQKARTIDELIATRRRSAADDARRHRAGHFPPRR